MELGIEPPFPDNRFKTERSVEGEWTMKFWKSGNALIESSLLMAFIAMASASLFLGAGGGINHQRDLTHHEQSFVCR